MRIPVKCKNCGIKWLRVIVFGVNLELTEDLQYNCPKCGSNWCETILIEEVKNELQETSL